MGAHRPGASPVGNTRFAPAPGSVIAFVLKGYPRLSETFILREILLLEAAGHTLHIFAMRHPGESKVHEMVGRVRAPVTYIDPLWRHVPTAILSNLGLLARHPIRYARAMAHAIAESVRARDGIVFKRFLQAGVLAARLPASGIGHLHSHFSHDPTTVACFAAGLSGIPYSFSAHAKDIYTQDERFLATKIARATFVVTCTEFNRVHLSRLARGATRVMCCYHGVSLDDFPRADRTPSNQPGDPTKAPHILSVGRLVPKKGFPALIDALSLLRQRGVDFRGTLVGDGPEEARLRALIAERGLGDQVVILPPMPQHELMGLFGQADVFVLACEIQADGDRDGIPNVIVEAMAMEIPVVSTRISGIPECIDDGVNGILVPERDPETFAAALGGLLLDPERARRLGLAGRTKVEREFDARHAIEPISTALANALRRSTKEVAHAVDR